MGFACKCWGKPKLSSGNEDKKSDIAVKYGLVLRKGEKDFEASTQTYVLQGL